MPQRPPEPESPGHCSGPGLFFAGLNNREGLSKPWFFVSGREKKDHFLVAPTHEVEACSKKRPFSTENIEGRPFFAKSDVGRRTGWAAFF